MNAFPSLCDEGNAIDRFVREHKDGSCLDVPSAEVPNRLSAGMDAALKRSAVAEVGLRKL